MDLKHLAADISLELLTQLPANESVVISPLSIIITLGVIFAGTDGICRENINNAFFNDSTQYRTAAKNFLEEFEEPIDYEDIILKTFVWPPAREYFQWHYFVVTLMRLKESFATEIRDDYSAEILLLEKHKIHKKMKEIKYKMGIGARDAFYNIMEDNLYKDRIGAGVFGFAGFNGMWRESFYVKDNNYGKDYFYPAEGAPKMMDFMSSEEVRPYHETENMIIVHRPYFNEFDFHILLPKANHSLESVLKDLSGKRIAELLHHRFDEYKPINLINLKVPRFNVSSRIDIIPLLKNLGVYPIFYPKLANFSRMSTTDDLYMDKLQHVAAFSNDRYGSNAEDVIYRSGYTPLPGYLFEDPPAPVHLNRPFAFFVTYKNHIVIAGKMNG